MRAFNRRNLWYLPAACALFFGARWVFQQGKPERLQDLAVKNDAMLGIHKGVAYFQAREFQASRSVTIKDKTGKNVVATITPLTPLLIRALPVTSKQERLIEERRPDNIFGIVQQTDDSLYYYARPHKVRPVIASVRPVIASPGGYGAGPSFIGAGSATTKPKSVVMRVPVMKVALFQMPLTGGPPMALRPDTPFHIAENSSPVGQPIAVVGDYIYWIEMNNRPLPPGATGSLRVIARHSGLPETLMTGLAPGTGLIVPEESKDSLWMSVPVAGATPRSDFYRVTTAERKPRRIVRKENVSFYFHAPLTLNERLYWTHDIYAINKSASDSPGYQTRHTEIFSAALDGSDQRTIYTFPDACYVTSIRVHKGKLYLEVYRGESRPMQSNRFLVRLEPGPPVRVQDIFHYPLRAGAPYFDGDYLYYTLKEERENFWDWSKSGLQPVEATVLCRYRLPR